MPRKPSETVQLKLRFPERLRIRIEAEAEKNERSMNAEIVRRLEQSFEKDDRAALLKDAAAEAIDEALRRILASSDSKTTVQKWLKGWKAE
jgi:hypothetical protein